MYTCTDTVSLCVGVCVCTCVLVCTEVSVNSCQNIHFWSLSGPPTLVEGDEHTALQFGEGKSIVLICKAKNHPLALDSVRFDWFKNNKKLVPDNRKIRIINSGENEKRIAYSTVQVCLYVRMYMKFVHVVYIVHVC